MACSIAQHANPNHSPEFLVFSTAWPLLSQGVLVGHDLPSITAVNRRKHVTQMNIEHLVIRVRAEFQEMPGLSLTVRQAERLWGLAPDVCAQVVDVLVSRDILKRHGDTFSLAK
jgi:hypothetical protein